MRVPVGLPGVCETSRGCRSCPAAVALGQLALQLVKLAVAPEHGGGREARLRPNHNHLVHLGRGRIVM